MDYKSIAVSMTLDRSNRACLVVAADLAERFDARVIGIAASEVRPPLYFAEGEYAQKLLLAEEEAIRKQLADAEAEFRGVLAKRTRHIEWRSALIFANDFVATQARSADLIVTSVRSESVADPYAGASPSDLVMEVGRPVLVVPESETWLDLRRILIAWKDTKESRRAVFDALPLLSKAQDVTVAEVCKSTDKEEALARTNDVVAWLGAHGISASALAETVVDDAATKLDDIASNIGAGLVVAGAYGHSRFREWVLGGVTRQYVTRPSRCVFLSR
ncbi:MAG: universal stress protein [Xanthobacteraceae bacterium]|nr:universal stress protein [Xanthobacteraceae bacterium]